MLTAIICFIFSIVAFILGVLQFMQKGKLLNNAYIYASEKERNKMNKTPYYRQSGVVFSIIGLSCLLQGIEIILQTEWLSTITILMMFVLIFYAMLSTIVIYKSKNKKNKI